VPQDYDVLPLRHVIYSFYYVMYCPYIRSLSVMLSRILFMSYTAVLHFRLYACYAHRGVEGTWGLYGNVSGVGEVHELLWDERATVHMDMGGKILRRLMNDGRL
nr:hypothetical protein [Tanacetum cinerariifolium]